MRFWALGTGSRLACFALASAPAWACATAVDNPVGSGGALDTSGTGGTDFVTGGASGTASAGTLGNTSGSSMGGSVASAGSSSAFGGSGGMTASGGGGGGASGQ
ncbi:MAG TPA: hypothetical protein VNW92_12905, partial [Polyangiaceae bacterium]|nr:hypothetical protein [Polyangiaceae bacterium]